jgi:ribosome biogenesis GTPase
MWVESSSRICGCAAEVPIFTMPTDGSEGLREGIVVRSLSGQCQVRAQGRTYTCRVRGRLKRGERRVQTVVVIGDRVRFRPLDTKGTEERTGVIEEVLPRHNRISRLAARRSGGHVEQVLMANLDQVVAVQSVREPDPQSGFVDRLLVAAERFGTAGVLCLNKCDLDPVAARDARWEYYAGLGYRVLRTSALTGRGLDDLREVLRERISLLLGASGVGKSALLNGIQPGLDLHVAAVSEKSGLGRHTTSRSELFPLDCGGFIADSPGMRGFDPWDIAPADLRDYFPDWREPALSCRFRSCLHREEPGCGVKEGVQRGDIPAWRYEAYLALLRDLEERSGGRHGRRPQ